ncbi:MAG: polysaccharide deacetylase family protein [Cyclobacteriaceae bacterium]
MKFYTHRTPHLIKKLYPNRIWDFKQESNSIFLTFDDGPKPEVTDYILEMLEQFNARATFFVVGGNVEKFPDLFKKTVSKGHTIGNHTFNHLNGWNTSSTDYINNVDRCDLMLQSNCINTRLFRPPYGRMKPSQARPLAEKKKIVMWDYLVGDFDAGLSADQCLKRALNQIRPGSIVLFHDSLKAFGKLQKILPIYLQTISKKGLTMKAINLA